MIPEHNGPIQFAPGERPTIQLDSSVKELDDEVLKYIYTGRRLGLSDFAIKGVVRACLSLAFEVLPDVATTFTNPDDPITKKVAKVAEETELVREILCRKIRDYYNRYVDLEDRSVHLALAVKDVLISHVLHMVANRGRNMRNIHGI